MVSLFTTGITTDIYLIFWVQNAENVQVMTLIKGVKINQTNSHCSNMIHTPRTCVIYVAHYYIVPMSRPYIIH